MEKFKEKLSDEAAALDKYLRMYTRCKNRKHSLERRKDSIMQEFESPLRSVVSDGMPRGSSSGIGCAALSYELDEIRTRIDEKIKEMEKKYVRINDVIEFLPENSTERAILEYKYIDNYSWNKICNLEHMSRTPATQYWRKGLYKLLEFAKVQEIVREYRKSEAVQL